MSKFLKFIVNLFLILAIIVTAGIIVPPLLGVNTTIVDTAGMDTNLPLGSVTYSRDKAVMELQAGDEILKESGTATYAYIIQEGDAATGEFSVVSATEPDASPETVILRNSVSEVVLTIPYIGFVVVAMQSLEGRIIIGLVILFIIILFILSELWKKRDDDEDDEDEENGDLGNVQAASAERTGDAEKSVSGTGVSVGYSENVTDNRGYGTVSQDTASIAAAMVGLEAVVGRRESKEMRTAEARADSKATDTLQDAELPVPGESDGNSPDEQTGGKSENAATLPEKDVYEAPACTTDSQAAALEPEVPEVTGDTKVFAGYFSPQKETVSEDAETLAGNDFDGHDRTREETQARAENQEKAGAPRAEKTIEKALIAETEKAAASWSGNSAEQTQEPKKLWSWTDEPFENELDGDGWNSFPAGSPAAAMEYPERFAPVERMTRQEIIEQARTGGSEPKIQRDEVTGIDIIDYSDLL